MDYLQKSETWSKLHNATLFLYGEYNFSIVLTTKLYFCMWDADCKRLNRQKAKKKQTKLEN